MADTFDSEQWLTIAQACETLGVSERTLRRRLETGTYQTKLEHGRRFVCLPELPDNPNKFDRRNGDELVAQLQAEVAHLRDIVDKLTAELAETRQSADEASNRSDSIIMQLSKTLETQQLQLKDQTFLIEDLRQSRPFWQRLFQRQKSRDTPMPQNL